MSDVFVPQCAGVAMRLESDLSNIDEFVEFIGGSITYTARGDGLPAAQLHDENGDIEGTVIHGGDFALKVNSKIIKMYQEDYFNLFLSPGASLTNDSSGGLSS